MIENTYACKWEMTNGGMSMGRASSRRSRYLRSKSTMWLLPTTTNHFLQRYNLAPHEILCPTFQAPALRPQPLALTSRNLGPMTSSVCWFKPLKSCFLDSPFALPSAARTSPPLRTASRSLPELLSLFLATPGRRAASIIIHPSVRSSSTRTRTLPSLSPFPAWATDPIWIIVGWMSF